MDGASWLEEEDGTGCVGAGESPRLGDIDAAETEAAELDAASELDAAAINPDLDASTKECAFDASRSGSMLACSAAQYATTAGCRRADGRCEEPLVKSESSRGDGIARACELGFLRGLEGQSAPQHRRRPRGAAAARE